jgi:hypothetical protein
MKRSLIASFAVLGMAAAPALAAPATTAPANAMSAKAMTAKAMTAKAGKSSKHSKLAGARINKTAAKKTTKSN